MDCAFHLERPWPFEDLGPGCQFQKSQFPEFAPDLIGFDGKTWCPFHLPTASADDHPSPKADWNGKQVGEFNEAIFAFIDKAKAEDRTADLTGVVFPGDIAFYRYQDETSALPPISFVRAQFSGDAWFYKARFSSPARFSEVRFSGFAFFEKAQFSDTAYFEKAQFNRAAQFAEAQFSGHAVFNDAQFRGDADFSGAPSAGNGGDDGEARGLGDRFHFAIFTGARFGGGARFTNRRFLEKTDFRGAIFSTAPEFHNCILHQDTVFPGEENFQDRSGKAAPAYRTLKLAMEQLRARDEEAMFHALELECRRKHPDTPLSVKVFSLLYEWAADYGRSFMRPLCRLLGFYGVFFLIYLAAFTSNPVPWDIPITWDIAAGVGRFTVAQVVRPFSALTLTEGVTVGSESVEVSLGLACLAAIQSVLSLGLIALFILALRRRFRMG